MNTNEKWILGCQAPDCGQLADGFFNAGPMFADDRDGATPEDSKMQVVYDVTEADFDVYVAALKESGICGYLERSQAADKFFAFAQNGKYYHVRFTAKRGEIRVIEDVISTPIDEFGYTENGPEKTVFYQYALYYDPDNAVTDKTVNCGMLYIVKLSDNSLFMIDGGHIYQSSDEMIEGLWQFLRHITNTSEDGTIRISGWYCTHAHDDHHNGFTKLLNRYHEQILLERVMFNIPHFSYGGNYALSTFGMKETVPYHYPEAKLLKLHAGQIFDIADMTIEVLYAHEDAAEKEDLDRMHLEDFNCTSSILKLTINGEDIMMLGDTNVETEVLLQKYSEPNLWKADMVQVAHHCFNYLDVMYEWIKAPVAVLPNSFDNAHREENIGKLAGVLKWVKNDQIYYESDATYGFVAGEKGFELVEKLPLIGGPYDDSGIL